MSTEKKSNKYKSVKNTHNISFNDSGFTNIIGLIARSMISLLLFFFKFNTFAQIALEIEHIVLFIVLLIAIPVFAFRYVYCIGVNKLTTDIKGFNINGLEIFWNDLLYMTS